MTVSGKSVIFAVMNFTGNRHTLTSESVCLSISPDTPLSIAIVRSTFVDNVGLYSTVATIEGVRNLTISGSTFQGNIALSTSAGIALYPLESENTILRVTNCTFQSNSARSSGVLSVLDNLGGVGSKLYSLDMQILDSVFVMNKAQFLGSCLASEGYIQLSQTSIVQRCAFQDNWSEEGGAVSLEFASGALTFTNCSFIRNEGGQGAAIAAKHHSNSRSNTYLALTTCLFHSNWGESIVLAANTLKPLLLTFACTFFNNSGSSVIIQYGVWRDNHSLFDSNSAKEGTFVVLNLAQGVLSGTVVRYNKAVIKAGVAMVSDYSDLSTENCTFEDNTSGGHGGAVYVDQQSTYTAVKVSISRNTALGRGSAIYSITSVVMLSDCHIQANWAKVYGSVDITESNLTMIGSEMDGNWAGQRSPGIVAGFSNIWLLDSYLHNQTAADMGALLFSNDLNTVLVQRCVLEDAQAPQGGAIYSGTRTVLDLRDSVVLQCSSAGQGAVLACRICTAHITNVTFYGNNGESVIYSNQATTNLVNCVFENFTGSAVSSSSSSLQVRGCRFEGGSALYGAAISALDCFFVLVSDSVFAHSQSKLGGAVYSEGTGILDQPAVSMYRNNVFQGNRAIMGGALYSSSLDVLLQNNHFLDNHADPSNYPGAEIGSEGVAGAVYVSCPHFVVCNYTITLNTFERNTASHKGGVMYWFDTFPHVGNNTWTNNSAPYAKEIASFPIRLALMYENGTLASYLPDNSSIPLLAKFEGIASGQVFNGTVRIALVDHYDHVVTSDNSSTAQVVSNDLSKLNLLGVLEVVAVKGVFGFTNIKLSGVPTSTQRLTVTTTGVQLWLKNFSSDPLDYHDAVAVDLTFRSCQIGETLQGIACYVCPEGTYSLDPNLPCNTCPMHATCLGNWTMVPDSGYWRADPISAHFFPCPNPDACLGSPSGRLSLTGECKDGYGGNLCNVCQKGYSRQGRNMCNKCPSLTSNIALSSLLGLGASILLIIAVGIAIRGATRPRSEFPTYLKIFVNYAQMVVVAAGLNVNWPGFVSVFLSGQETVGSVAEQLFSYECLAQEFSTTENMFYRKIAAATALPGLLFLGAILIWLGLRFCTQMKSLLNKSVASLVMILFMLHPSITKSTFAIFACTEIKRDQFWVTADMSLRCWEFEHVRFILVLALPCCIVWIFGLPLLCLGLLYRSREHLTAEPIQIKYSFLFKGYRTEMYYWEFVILYRKVILVCTAVFLTTVSTLVQALSVLAVLLVCLFLQIVVKPFRTPAFNKLEIKSIMVSLITIYVGLYFEVGYMRNFHSGLEFKVVLFVLILLTNAYFLFTWCRRVIPIVVTTIMNTFRRPRENYQVRPMLPAGPHAPDHSDISGKSSNSAHRLNDSRVRSRQSSASASGLAPANTSLLPGEPPTLFKIEEVPILEDPQDVSKEEEQ